MPDAQRPGTERRVKFSPDEQRLAGRVETTCVGVFELRARGLLMHLQVISFYPAISRDEIR